MARWRFVGLVVLVAALLAGLVVVARFSLRPRPRPHRVLVVLATETRDGARGAWWTGPGGRASARCADVLLEKLRAIGLEAVPAGARDVADALAERTTPAELVAAATRLEAALVVVGKLQVVGAQPLSGSDGQTDYAVELRAELRSATADASQPLGDPPPRLHLTAGDEQAALLSACEALPERLLPQLATALSELGPVKEALAREPRRRSLDERMALERMAPALELARRVVAARTDQAKAEQSRRDDDARREQGPLPKHLLGSFIGEEYWVGPGPGDAIALMALPTWNQLSEDGAGTFVRKADHELLLLARADGSERRPLLETYNVYSFPSVSADGAHVAAVLDQRQWSKALVVVDVAGGAQREVVSHRSHYFSSPLLSPDGSRLLFWASTERDGEQSLEVVRVDGQERRVLVPGPFARMDLPAWSVDGRSVFVSLQELGQPRAVLWRLDAQTGERQPLVGAQANGEAMAAAAEAAGAEPPSSWHRPTPAPDGSYLALVEQTERGVWIGRLELPAGPYRRLASIGVGRMAVSPDSRTIAFETAPTSDPDDPRASDTEIALLGVDGTPPRILTRNTGDDTLGGWGRDGRRLYFQQRDPELVGQRPCHRIYWLEP